MSAILNKIDKYLTRRRLSKFLPMKRESIDTMTKPWHELTDSERQVWVNRVHAYYGKSMRPEAELRSAEQMYNDEGTYSEQRADKSKRYRNL